MHEPNGLSSNKLFDRVLSLSLPLSSEASFLIIDLENIRKEEAELGRIYLDAPTDAKIKTLVFEEDQNRSVIIHSILRLHLAKILNIDIQEIRILRDSKGKPYIEDHPVHFNLSHTKNYALIGFHPHFPLGVDIEKVNNQIDFANVSDVFMHPLEKEKHLTSSDLSNAFFTIWCAKEALLKAKGMGFLIDSIPQLESLENVFADSRSFSSMGLTIHVFDKILPEHKVAVCLNNV